MSNSTQLKVAVIGLGNMGKHHVRNYHNIENCQLVAVCDLKDGAAETYAEEFNCNAYSSIHDMLDKEEIDALTITSPTSTHYEVAKMVIERGISVLIEKPIADNVEHATELIELAKQNNVTLMVGHIERFNPAVTALKNIIEAGELGDITSLISKRVGVFPAQIKDANVIIDLAVHDIDIFSYLLNREPDGIFGNAGRALIDDREDYAEIFLTYGQQNGIVQVNWITPIRIRQLSVTGTKGYAELNYMTQELVVHESNYTRDTDHLGDPVIKFDTPNTRTIPIDNQEPLNLELRHFLDSVRTNTSPLITGEVGRNALRTALDVMSKMQMTSH